MKQKRREPGALLFSVAIHAVVAFAILNAAFHYDFSGMREPTAPPPTQEKIAYVSVPVRAGSPTGDTTSAPAKTKNPSRGISAPVETPVFVAPPSPPTSGTPDGVEGGKGRGAEVGATVGIVPGDPDPRLSSDHPHEFYPAPKSHAERVDSAVKASIYAYNDSVARAMAAAGKAPGDWTFEKNGKKWGVDGNKIYLGKFAIPSAVLAALPIRIQGNPGETINDRLVTTRRADLLLHADAQFHDDEFKSAVKRIRERKDRERKERQEATRPAAAPDIIP
ncbi:MAG: hypothetical protein ABIY52_16475 [Gemmatimonadaceae bacterium]